MQRYQGYEKPNSRYSLSIFMVFEKLWKITPVNTLKSTLFGLENLKFRIFVYNNTYASKYISGQMRPKLKNVAGNKRKKVKDFVGFRDLFH